MSATKFLLSFLIIAVFFFNTLNLTYNSPFNDEAIYIVVGKVGVFYKDWQTLDSFTWIMGNPLFYTPLTAIAYELGGIAYSRGLNVIFLLIFLFTFYHLVKELDSSKHSQKAGLFSATIIGFSSAAYYLSRLATMDMGAFTFLTVSLLFITKAVKTGKDNYFILSSVMLFVGFCFKYTVGLYFPLFFFIWIYLLYRKSIISQKYFLYFLLPLGTMVTFYLLIYWNAFYTLYNEQVASETKQSVVAVLEEFFITSNVTIIPFIIGSIVLFKHKMSKLWLTVVLFGVWILISHLVSQRVHTLDKHAFITVSSMSLIGGIGLSKLITNKTSYAFVIFTLFMTVLLSRIIAPRYDRYWINTTNAEMTLKSIVNKDDKILTEFGDSTTLALMDSVPLNQIITFNYFSYDGIEGEEAYKKAFQDNYFDYLAIVTGDTYKDYFSHSLVHSLAQEESKHHEVIYADEAVSIFKVNQK